MSSGSEHALDGLRGKARKGEANVRSAAQTVKVRT
jgi:hypothetical protein